MDFLCNEWKTFTSHPFFFSLQTMWLGKKIWSEKWTHWNQIKDDPQKCQKKNISKSETFKREKKNVINTSVDIKFFKCLSWFAKPNKLFDFKIYYFITITYYRNYIYSGICSIYSASTISEKKIYLSEVSMLEYNKAGEKYLSFFRRWEKKMFFPSSGSVARFFFLHREKKNTAFLLTHSILSWICMETM